MSTNPLDEMVIRAASEPMTQEGRAWLMKALHPSDASHGMSGIPTKDARPTVPLNFMVTQNIAAPTTTVPWSADVLLNPSPLYFGKVITSAAGGFYGTNTVYNSQLGITNFSEFGTTARNWHINAMNMWFNNVTKFRLCYASVTATLSASSTSNEGVVTAAQYPYSFREVNNTSFNLTTPAQSFVRSTRLIPVGLRPASGLQAMVGSTTWEAREGAYSILRLSEESFNWQTPGNTRYVGAVPNTYQISQCGLVPTSAVTDLTGAAAASAIDVPFGPQGIWGNNTVSGTGATTVLSTNNSETVLPSQDFFSHLKFSGLDASATIQLTFRIGYEAVVPPESIYVGQVTPALAPDETALNAYFNAARFLQSAYPASYNIFGALAGFAARAMPVLKDIGMKVLPVLGNSILAAMSGGNSTTTPSNNVTTPETLQPRAPFTGFVNDTPRIRNARKKIGKRQYKPQKRNTKLNYEVVYQRNQQPSSYTRRKN
jgi:hypothetical protein